MKKLLLTLTILIATSISVFAQGSIDGISILPANPTTADPIYIIVDLTFATQGCEDQTLNHSVTGNTVLASSHHCIGMLTAICNDQDTFELPPQAAGTYLFDLTLTTGSLPSPCTPGFAIDDQDTLSFTVVEAVSVPEPEKHSQGFQIQPVPAQNHFNVIGATESTAVNIYGLDGRLVESHTLPFGQTMIQTQLGQGIYLVQVLGNSYDFGVQKLVIANK